MTEFMRTALSQYFAGISNKESLDSVSATSSKQKIIRLVMVPKYLLMHSYRV